jgi:carbon storage regulator
MLVLGRKVGERLYLGDDIEVVVLGTHRNHVKLGIIAPKEVSIRREEVQQRFLAAQQLQQTGETPQG